MSSKPYNAPEKDNMEPIVTHEAGELAEKGHIDVAAKFLASIDPSVKDAPVTASEARKVLRKIDFIILPIIAGTVILSAVDKVIISNASILGMSHDLDLIGNQFSWVGSIFYFGFLIFEFPTAVLIQKLPVAKLLAGLVFCWAVLMCCTAATQEFAGLATVRFIMGCMEAGAFPIASIITVMWYTNKEQPIRVAFWYNQVC
jgi:MFS transporter, ACS family, allantoate permease